MDELTRYVFFNYMYLLTVHEAAAYKSILGQQKVQSSDSPKMQNLIRSSWISSDPEVRALLEKGEDHFMNSVRDRILREHREQVFLNHCPKCRALAKTPRARQCPKCFYSWHDEN